MAQIKIIVKFWFLTLFTSFFLLQSCTEHKTDISFLYNTFRSTRQVTHIINEHGEKEEVPGFSIHTDIQKDSITIFIENDVYRLGYDIVSADSDSVTFNTKINLYNIVSSFVFTYYINKDAVILRSPLFSENIELISYAELMKKKTEEYASVKLYADISKFGEKEKQLLSLLFDAAKIMDDLYWEQAFPGKEKFLTEINDDSDGYRNAKKFFMINYGPWEHLNNNLPFIEGVKNKSAQGTFYPEDMTTEEFTNADIADKTSWYTIIRRNNAGKLYSIPYSEFYRDKLNETSDLLVKASELSENESFARYLRSRAQALLTNDYYESDIDWMDLKNNNIDFIIGPIESYNDEMFGYKTSFESFILLKDHEWSVKLDRFAKLLPDIQKSLPVDEEYKRDVPGKNSELAVYEALYYAGDCNAGSKTIAINLPNDKKVNEVKGSRKLQLKNSMKAKFEKILVPISEILIAAEQRKNINFDAFFDNVMFHEVAHGLGISKTLDNKMLVTEALKDIHTSLEECKADILGLYIVTWLHEKGELKNNDLLDNYVTFIAGIFRSVRFGASSSHGKANMIEFNYFEQNGAFTKKEDGTYYVNFDNMKKAVNSLGRLILTIQGDGNYTEGKKLLGEMGVIKKELSDGLNKVSEAGIPRDIVFEQGKPVIGL